MFLTKWLFGTAQNPGAAEETAFAGLLSVKDLAQVLKRERARADRSGDAFSLLAFSAEDSHSPRAVLARAATILKQRRRSTDELGWLDGRRIGVVLPATPVEGAWTLADDVLARHPVGAPLPCCQVYGHPRNPFSEQSSRGAEDAVPRPPSAERPVQTMETLFVQSMPLWKRTVDVALSAVALVLLLPLFLIVAAAVKLTSPGPLLFKQQRSGRGGKPFVIYKFRSMIDGAERSRKALAKLSEQDGPAFKIRSDPRVTPLGRLLRATSVDELPQLWNVLRGDMSLVGPRPLPCEESDACLDWQRRRLDAVPGLTCIWQVSGRSRVSFTEWMRMDLRYVGSRSLPHDVMLILRTLPALLFRRGW